jgi:hypothetical protein
MNSNSPSFADQADQYAALAERYAQEALRHLPQAGLEFGEEERAQMRLRLQTQFQFPQLSDLQLRMLAALYWQQQTLARLVNIPWRHYPASLQTQAERVTDHVEQNFMALVEMVKDVVGFESLSPAQRILFEQRYSRISFEVHPE